VPADAARSRRANSTIEGNPMKLPTLGQVASFGRHVVSYSAGAVTMAVALHAISGSDGASITGAVGQIVTGINSIAGGIATLLSIGTGLWAAWKQSPLSQLLAVASNPNVTKVVAPAIAESVPHDKVVAQ
jgi:hypothetical protein